MSDDPKDGPQGDAGAETPIQRALRLKKAALATKPKAPGGDRGKHQPSPGVAAGASRPWMKR
ncbi:MAG: hypothetical protein JF588_09430 [Caulobacterales bacterium]|nr:hypothetical protein [Caulobacterales bacterium]